MQNSIKIILVVLLLGCLIDFPYGYYQLVRFSAMAGFVYLAIDAHQNNISKHVFIYIVLALLFQPFIKVALGRTIWNFVDVVVAIWLLTTLSSSKKQ